MSLIFNEALIGAAGQGGAYQIEQSLRFDGSSAYLSRTPSSDTSTNKKGTFSVWIKSLPASGTNGGTFVGAADSYYYAQFFNERFYFGNDTSYLDVAGQRRDPSAWYHVVYVFDTTLATANDRTKIYVNGTRQTDIGTYNTQPSQNASFKFLNTAQAYNLGRRPSGSSVYFDGYFAELHFVDGQALDSEDFGEYDQSGVWRPIKYTGSHGTNGFYLKFDPSATNGIGHDHSGNGNNWTPSGFTTSGTGTDVMSDTPTTNFATLNPLIGHDPGGLLAPTFSDGNLTVAPQVTSSDNSRVASATLARNPADGGVWRWEMVVNNNNNASYGIMAIDEDYGQGNFGPYWAASGLGGTLSISGGASGGLQEQHQTISAGDVIGIVVSFDDNEIGWYINGTRRGFRNGCNFSNYTHLVPFFKESTRTQTPCTLDVNFGQKAFQYTTSGDAWGDLSLLPAPEIADGSKYFKPLIYAPDGSSSFAVTGVGFQPDLVWVKSRVYNEDHQLNDAVRGATKGLQSNLQSSETTQTNGLTSFDSDGFTVGNLSDYNYNGDSIISWNWLAGNGTSSNTDGSISSTVSVSTSSGFSIVTWTGSQADGTVGHGLNVAPSMIIFKRRNNVTSWPVYHSAIGPSNFVQLNETTASGSSGTSFGSTPTAPTSTVFSVGDNGGTNYGTMVAYCFAEVEGYSKFGTYIGNGSSNGPFVYCGFKPAFVLFKSTGSSTNWTIIDNARSTYNPVEDYLKPNASQAETDLLDIDMLSNGFKLRGTSGGDHNQSGTTFLFAAFAENPFGGDGVSPATAR